MINVEMIKYKVNDLYQNFIKKMNIRDDINNNMKFIYVLKLHGLIIGEHYVILNNEHWDEYNYYYMLSKSLGFAFGFIERRERDWSIRYDDTTTLTQEDEIINDKIYDVILNTPSTNSATDIIVDDEYDIIEKIREYLVKEIKGETK